MFWDNSLGKVKSLDCCIYVGAAEGLLFTIQCVGCLVGGVLFSTWVTILATSVVLLDTFPASALTIPVAVTQVV
ncbi:unnamed protein product, partial [Dibothriocephalus latus]